MVAKEEGLAIRGACEQHPVCVGGRGGSLKLGPSRAVVGISPPCSAVFAPHGTLQYVSFHCLYYEARGDAANFPASAAVGRSYIIPPVRDGCSGL